MECQCNIKRLNTRRFHYYNFFCHFQPHFRMLSLASRGFALRLYRGFAPTLGVPDPLICTPRHRILATPPFMRLCVNFRTPCEYTGRRNNTSGYFNRKQIASTCYLYKMPTTGHRSPFVAYWMVPFPMTLNDHEVHLPKSNAIKCDLSKKLCNIWQNIRDVTCCAVRQLGFLFRNSDMW